MGQKNKKKDEKVTEGKALGISIGAALIVLGAVMFLWTYIPIAATRILGILLACVGILILVCVMSKEEVNLVD